MTTKKTVTDAPASTEGVKHLETNPMLIISQQNLKTVCDWLNSDRMTMPQNEVRQCLNLLLTANKVEE